MNIKKILEVFPIHENDPSVVCCRDLRNIYRCMEMRQTLNLCSPTGVACVILFMFEVGILLPYLSFSSQQ